VGFLDIFPSVQVISSVMVLVKAFKVSLQLITTVTVMMFLWTRSTMQPFFHIIP